MLNCKTCTNFSVDSVFCLYAIPNVLQKMSNSYLHVHKDKHKVLHKWLQQRTITNAEE